MYSGWHLCACSQPYHGFSKIYSQPYLVSVANRIIATNTLCRKKGEFGHNIKYSGVICFKAVAIYIYLSAEIWQNCLVLTCQGFNLFSLLVEVLFSLLAFPFRLLGSCC